MTASLIENGQSMAKSNEFCLRGVEHLTHKGDASRTINRKTAMLAVLSEQQRLYGEESIGEDPSDCASSEERIAAAYSQAVCESVRSAYLTGLADESRVKADQRRRRVQERMQTLHLLSA